MAILTFTADGGGHGRIFASNATYLTARNAATGAVDTTTSRPMNMWSDPLFYVARGFAPFNIAAIPANASIVEGANTFIRAIGAGAANNDDSDSITVVESTQASDDGLVEADFNNIGSTQFMTAVGLGSWVAAGNNDFQLNAAGVAHIQSALEGYVLFAWRTTKDIAATQPAGRNYAIMVNNTNYLSVEYTVPSGFLAIL